MSSKVPVLSVNKPFRHVSINNPINNPSKTHGTRNVPAGEEERDQWEWNGKGGMVLVDIVENMYM